jgi:hypothetical protein
MAGESARDDARKISFIFYSITLLALVACTTFSHISFIFLGSPSSQTS